MLVWYKLQQQRPRRMVVPPVLPQQQQLDDYLPCFDNNSTPITTETPTKATKKTNANYKTTIIIMKTAVMKKTRVFKDGKWMDNAIRVPMPTAVSVKIVGIVIRVPNKTTHRASNAPTPPPVMTIRIIVCGVLAMARANDKPWENPFGRCTVTKFRRAYKSVIGLWTVPRVVAV